MLALRDVLRDTARLYRAFFARTVVTSGLAFAVVCLAESVGPWPVVVLSLVGTSFAIERMLVDALGVWASLTLASTLTTPFAAHALNVVYYRITEPDRPVLTA